MRVRRRAGSQHGYRGIGVATALAALAALGVAYWAQDVMHLNPCPLCLWERWPYRAAAGLGVLAVITPARLARFLLVLAVLALAVGAAIAFVHVGVEMHWWPSPLPECNGILTPGAPLPLTPAKSCDEPTYLIPGLPDSMAAMDLQFAFLFAVALLVALSSRRRRSL